MSQNYEEYLKEIEMGKNKPVKIKFSYCDRGFYCPSCLHGTAIDTPKCKYCGQLLLPYLSI